jgi:hypothetical protein
MASRASATAPIRTLTGRCLCGAVRFEADAPLRPVSVCHCRQCARWTGSYVMATSVPLAQFRLTGGEDAIGWYAASDVAERGFCRTCGSSLFWKPNSGDRIAILAGSLDPPTGLVLDHHIFVASKSDYYEIHDDLPQEAEWRAAPKPAG